MRFHVKVGQALVGFAAKSARGGENAEVICRDFLTSEDGARLTESLESISEAVFNYLPEAQRPDAAAIRTLLVIQRGAGELDIYVNETTMRCRVVTTRQVQAGDVAYDDDIAEIQAAELNTEIPADAGVIFYWRLGWRHALYFDLGPAHGPPRTTAIEQTLGTCHLYLLRQELFRIPDEAWNRLINSGWFPFVLLGSSLTKKMIKHASSGFDVDDLLPEIAANTRSRIDRLESQLNATPLLAPHRELLVRGLERFKEGDFLSCIALIYPRIEGLMRSYAIHDGQSERFRPDHLINVTSGAATQRNAILLFPSRFEQYLRQNIFRNFNPADEVAPLSRHSFAHGVAAPAEFDEKRATQAVLVLAQLCHFLLPAVQPTAPS